MKMSYFVVGTNQRKKAAEYYNSLFADQQWQMLHDGDRMTLWTGDEFMFALADPFDGEPASVGNGSMVGFQFDNDDEVASLHARALELGGSDEGAPGIRSGRFAAYVRDLDGNKLCFFC